MSKIYSTLLDLGLTKSTKGKLNVIKLKPVFVWVL